MLARCSIYDYYILLTALLPRPTVAINALAVFVMNQQTASTAGGYRVNSAVFASAYGICTAADRVKIVVEQHPVTALGRHQR
jgi:hypothetical protein